MNKTRCESGSLVLLLMMALVVASHAADVYAQPSVNNGTVAFDAPIPDVSAPSASAKRDRLSVSDVLAWRRLAMQVTNSNAPRIDGTSAVGDSGTFAEPSSPAEAGPPAPSDDSTEGSTPSIPATTPGITPATLQIPDDITPEELIAVLRLLQKQVDTNTEMIGNNAILVQQLRGQLDAVTDSLNRNLLDQREILQQQQAAITANQQVLNSVTSDDGSGGRWLQLSGNMSLSNEFVDQVGSAIRQTEPTDGALVIRNPLTYNQVIVVNDQQHNVVAGATLTIRVPIGNVITRVPGGQTFSWYVSAKQNTIRLRLVPPAQ